MNKKILMAAIYIIVLVILCTNVFAMFGTDPQLNDIKYNEDMVNEQIKNKMGYVWATIATVVQVAAVACVVFAGLRYMFASADQKADIKQGMIYLGLGAVLVFGAVLVVRLVVNAANQIM